MATIAPKNITELARRELEEELDRYETPEECLEYLMDDSHFKSISQELVEILQDVCGLTGRNTNEMVQFIAERLSEIENPEGYSKEGLRNKKKVVAKWFNKNAVPDRDSAIKICFALNLDYEKAKEFLRKGCKSYAFNVRNAEDAVYMYCLIKGKTYKDANALLQKYYEAETPASSNDTVTIPANSSTTQILLKAIKDGSMDDSMWETDDAFLHKFLIPNKNRFTGYAKTATKIYYEQKRCLQERLIRNSINEAVDGMNTVNVEEDSIPIWEYNAIIDHLIKTLRVFSANHDEFSKVLSKLEADRIQASNIWDDIMELFNKEGFKKPSDIGAFLDEMMPIDAMLREVMHDLPYDWWKTDRDFASYSRSSISDLVQGLTIKRGFEDFEKSPKEKTFTISTRKIIMLMFYLNYIDGWTPDTDFDKKNYDLFFNELTNILDDCQFASLYHADPFDWLMLRSVIGIERGEPWTDIKRDKDHLYETEEHDPSEYFFKVLKLSFDSSAPEKYLSRFEALKRTYDYLCYEDARKFSFGKISYGDKVSHSPSTNAAFTHVVEDNIDRNLSAKISEASEQLKNLYKETIAAINTVQDKEEHDILIKYYIDFKRFNEIADEMNMRSNVVHKKYLKALEHVDIPSALLNEFED